MKNNSNAVLLRRVNPWSLLLILAVSLLLPLGAAAQNGSFPPPSQKKAAGVVLDENGGPIVGCNIIVKGTTVGTTTDSEGRFSFDVPASAQTLVFSYLGMEPVEQPVGLNMHVAMVSSASALDEVVVVGYGTQKKVTLSGAVSSISNKEILTTKGPSLAVALAGKVPGLRIRQTSGMPGSFSTNINVRGMGTPMIVIDGVVRNETTEFQKLNPEDIESITVLKDASAAIYGINSSNGAILVTTKAGSQGPLRVSLNANWGFSQPTQHTKMMNAHQYWEIRERRRRQFGRFALFRHARGAAGRSGPPERGLVQRGLQESCVPASVQHRRRGRQRSRVDLYERRIHDRQRSAAYGRHRLRQVFFPQRQ